MPARAGQLDTPGGAALSALSTLQSLNLAGNYFKGLPAQWSFPELLSLNLSGNRYLSGSLATPLPQGGRWVWTSCTATSACSCTCKMDA